MVGLLFLQKLPKECCLFLLKRIYSVSYIFVVLTSVFMGKKILDAWDYTSGPWFEEQTYNVFCSFLIWVEGWPQYTVYLLSSDARLCLSHGSGP